MAAVALLSGCDLATNYLKPDRAANLEMQDFRDSFAQRLPEDEDGKDDAGAASIPPLQPYIAESSESLKSMPLVSVAINQSVPLRDILFELAEQADYDLELDPAISGSIIFTARNRPLDQVIERISDIAGLRYRFNDDVLRVEVDRPYNKTYKVDYLSYIRKNTGSIRNDVTVVSGDGADTGSSFQASTESEADFWGELSVALTQILGGDVGTLKTKTDPRITATEQNPDVQPVAPASEDGKVVVQPPDAVLKVESLPVSEDTSVTGPGSTLVRSGFEQGFSMNKQAGMINVFATERAHKEVSEYLKILRRSATAQVLIEAKILEVSLRDEFSTGIDWRILNTFSGEGAINFLRSAQAAALDSIGPETGSLLSNPDGTLAGSSFAMAYGGNDVQALVEAIAQFGAVRALASPRLTVLNNQSAILNVATNQVYFEVDVDTTTDEGVTQVDIDSDIRNVPVGVLVNVIPSINLDKRTISMAVRPTITNVDAQIPDPAVAFVVAATPAAAGITSNIPQLNVQEIDSVIQVNSGQAIVMGGLLQDRTESLENGVPVLSEVPMLGALFRQHQDSIQKTELVIFLRATILESPEDSINNNDKDMYRKFSGDRSPFKL